MKNQEYIDLTKKYRCEECGAVYTEDDITEDTEVLFDCGEHELDDWINYKITREAERGKLA